MAYFTSRFSGIAGLILLPVLSTFGVNISAPDSPYDQNFDSLLNTGTGNAWVNDSTIPGWHLFRQPASGPVAITAYNAGTGSSSTGSFYSFGATGSSERSFGGVGAGTAYYGSPASGTVAGWIALSLVNTSGADFNGFSVEWDGEQWRKSGETAAQSMLFEYGFGSTFGSVASWTAPGGNFDWSSPAFTATAAAIDGNVAGKVSDRGGNITGLNWSDGQTLWLRWAEVNDVGNDHGLGIDDFSFTAKKTTTTSSPVPDSLPTGRILASTFACLLFASRRLKA